MTTTQTQTTTQSIIAVQIIDTTTGHATRTELTGGLTSRQAANVVRNFKSAARGGYALSPGDERDRYQVHVVRAGENVRR